MVAMVCLRADQVLYVRSSFRRRGTSELQGHAVKSRSRFSNGRQIGFFEFTEDEAIGS